MALLSINTSLNMQISWRGNSYVYTGTFVKGYRQICFPLSPYYLGRRSVEAYSLLSALDHIYTLFQILGDIFQLSIVVCLKLPSISCYNCDTNYLVSIFFLQSDTLATGRENKCNHHWRNFLSHIVYERSETLTQVDRVNKSPDNDKKKSSNWSSCHINTK